ncbi:MAG: hypothetical protein ACLGXA_00835 [Acidobacteriota bacterium]
MIAECIHILPSGQKCRGTALRGHELCRHHAPKPALAGPPPIPRSQRFSRIARWSGLTRQLPRLDRDGIPFEAYSILLALLDDGDGGISDREAGCLLRALLRRFGSVPFPEPELAEQDRLLGTPYPSFPVPPGAELACDWPTATGYGLPATGHGLPATGHPHPGLRQPWPPMPQTQPTPRQPRPTLLQTWPSAK